MDNFVINGGHELFGEVKISGAKNAAVAIIPAAIFAEDEVVLENVPNISDVKVIMQILEFLGAKIERADDPNTWIIDTKNVEYKPIPENLASKFRASYYFIGAMLGRFNKAEVSMPGGCNFGRRPIDQHIKGFQRLGSVVDANEETGIITAEAEKLTGNVVALDAVSVGATINIMLSAVKARGQTLIENAAKEPHIVDLANFLNTMGADIRGAGTDTIKINGVETMHGGEYSIIPDQIEAGTYMTAVAACGGDVLINNVIPKHLESISKKLEEAGAEVIEYDDAVRVNRFKPLSRCHVKTMPHPGFPTDMQPQMLTVLTIAEGESTVNEAVWENRFQYIPELISMGASISIDGSTAHIEGVKNLTGTTVNAHDLRAGAAMIIAGLIAKGTTIVTDTIYVDRGYENVIEKFQGIGADIKRVPAE